MKIPLFHKINILCCIGIVASIHQENLKSRKVQKSFVFFLLFVNSTKSTKKKSSLKVYFPVLDFGMD